MEIGKTSTEIAPGLGLPHLSSAPGQLPPPRWWSSHASWRGMAWHSVAWRGMAWHPNGGDRWEFIGARWQWFSEFSLGCAFGITIWCICLSQDVYVVWYVFCASVGSNEMSLELGTLKIKQKLKILMPKTLWANETTSRTWRKTFGATSPWRSNPNIKRASQLNMLLPHTTFLWQLVLCCLDIPQPNSDCNDVWWIPLNEHRCGQYTISRSFS